jgi:phosphoglycerate kinase
MNYKTLEQLSAEELKNKRVLLRLDFNVPIKDGKVVDDFRIIKSLPTIQFLKGAGAIVIIIAHIEEEPDTLKPVYEVLKTHIAGLRFCEDCIESGKDTVTHLQSGEVLLCENLRLYDGEKRNDKDFSEKLASLGDIYVNDAFSVSHRKHASIVGIPKFLPGYIGLQFEEEIKNLSQCFKPAHPFVFVLGGAKFDTKLPLIQKFLPLADTIFIGGALANDFYKVKGLEVGISRVSETPIDLSELITNSKIILPEDVVVESSRGRETKNVSDVKPDEKILDAGEKTLADLAGKIEEAQCVLWNGPLGNYENGFKEPTLELARMIAQSNALSIVGGGDTLAAIIELGNQEKFGFISTGGGAMLDFLANETLPGLDALRKS